MRNFTFSFPAYMTRLAGLCIAASLCAPSVGCGSASADTNETGESGNTGQPPLPTWPESQSDVPHDTDPQLSVEQQDAFRASQIQFALDLFHETRDQEFADKNLALAGPTLQVAMGMLWESMSPTVYAETEATFHYDLGSPATHEAHNWWDAQLNELNLPEGEGEDGSPTDPVIVAPVNSIWAEESITVPAVLADTFAEHYGGAIKIAQFSTDSGGESEKINLWIEIMTHGLITDFFPPSTITPTTTMVLVNALYIKAPWANAFPAARTAARPFELLGGSTVDVATMQSDAMSARFVESADYTAVAIPLRGGGLEFIAIMPTFDYESFEGGLTTGEFQDVMAALEYGNVVVSIPKFKVDAKLAAAQRPLEALGLLSAWPPNWGATALGAISAVVHHSVLEIDEKGLEAAAASGVVVGQTSEGISEFTEIEIDRPFIFVLREVTTGSPLFLGRVLDPRG